MHREKGHPLWMCGFRPFFLLGSAYGIVAILLWGGFLLGWWNVPAGGDGVINWHAREMLLGFVAASLAGFILTAVPEFANTTPAQQGALARLVMLWAVGRLGAWIGLPAGYAILGLADIGLLLALLWHTGGHLRRSSRHRSLGYALVGLLLLTSAYYAALLLERQTLPWLRAIAGWYMILIVLAMSRISMRIVNRSLEELGLAREYVARPPRRNLAIVCLLAQMGAEFFLGPAPLTGWLSLAVGAAFFNLLSDWHLGKVLFCRWVFMLYAVYCCIGIGYFSMGLIILFDQPLYWLSAVRHLTYIGGIGLSIFAVFVIAGRAHAGLDRDERPWVCWGVGLLISAAVFRALHVWQGETSWLWLALLGWSLPLLLYARHYWRIFLRPREDGEWGC